MGINFPASPTVGQRHPQPAVAGIPVYTWDGEKWTTVGGSIAAYAPPADAVPLMDATPGLVGTATEYAREDHRHPTDASLLAYSGMQINGGMEVNQSGAATYTIAANGPSTHLIDSWKFDTAGVQNIAAAPNVGPPGFAASLQIGGNTIWNPSPAAGDYAVLSQVIEGYRISRLAWGTASAQPITLSFWVYSTKTGQHTGMIRNGVSITRTYAFIYTVNVASTWEYKTVTIPGCTDGTWGKDNTNGLAVSFTLLVGTTYATAPGVWTVGNFIGAPGSANIVSASGNFILFTGVTVLPGTQAPTAAQSPNIMRPYGEELVTCQRYYQKIFNPPGAALANGAAALYYHSFPFLTVMRANPSLSLTGVIPFASPTLNINGNSISTVNYLSTNSCNITYVAGVGVAAGTYGTTGTASAVVADARL